MAVAMVAAVAWQKHNMESDARLFLSLGVMSSNNFYRLSSGIYTFIDCSAQCAGRMLPKDIAMLPVEGPSGLSGCPVLSRASQVRMVQESMPSFHRSQSPAKVKGNPSRLVM